MPLRLFIESGDWAEIQTSGDHAIRQVNAEQKLAILIGPHVRALVNFLDTLHCTAAPIVSGVVCGLP